MTTTSKSQDALQIMQACRRQLRELGYRRAEWMMHAAIDDYLDARKSASNNRRYARKHTMEV